MKEALKIAAALNCSESLFSHSRAISIIEKPFIGPWTDVYSFGEKLPDSLHLYACFADKSLESEILSGQDWMKHADSFSPGFCVSSQGSEYQSPWHDGFEYIVAEIFFHPINEHQFIVNQEFILLFSLYKDVDGNYYDIDESGNKQAVIEFLENRVRVKTKYLIRYASAKQLLYVQFIDSRVSSSEHYEDCSECISYESFTSDENTYFLLYQTNKKRDYLFSMVYARSIVRPNPVEECGIWPYEKESDHYPEFIIEELPDGSFKRFTCDETKLSNYFGANQGAPHYLTPIYFKPSVLDRYRKLENFEVTERRLSCGSQWSIEIDHVNPDRVMVFLGDLGRDLPETERLHFLDHEISPTGQSISKEVIAQDFFCTWSEDTDGPIGNFLMAYKDLNNKWKECFGWSLFRQCHSDDANLIKQIRIPSTNSQEEFETIVQTLTRLLIDYIDESQLPKGENSGSINKLSSFLESLQINTSITPLRDIQQLRSTGTAHSKGENYDKVKARLLSGNWIEDTKTIIHSLTCFMQELATSLESRKI